MSSTKFVFFVLLVETIFHFLSETKTKFDETSQIAKTQRPLPSLCFGADDLQHPRFGKPRRGLQTMETRMGFPCPFRNVLRV